jgi:hypothetical protein
VDSDYLFGDCSQRAVSRFGCGEVQRPPKGSKNPEETKWKYCVYDKMHKDYGYTQEWVDFLIEKLKNPAEFDSLYQLETVSSEPDPALSPPVSARVA